MNLKSARLIIVLLILTLLASACDIDLESDSGNPPTAIVVTSTPTETGGDEQATATTPAPDDASPTEPGASTATGEAATETPATATQPESQPTGTSESTPEPDNGAVAEIEQIEADVVELRGLELLADLDEQIIDRQELAVRIEEILEEEYSEEEARIDALTFWLLRLIPDRSIDLYQLEVDLLSEQVAGYYDPETDELVVVTADGTLTVTDKVTMAHEIVHALQDQHFDLIAIDELATDADRGTAITTLIEGDATFAMTEYMLGYLDPLEIAALIGESFAAGDTAVLDAAPTYISEGLLFSYEAGQTFTTALHDDGGYEAINAAFEDPPASTEQILHPEKYLGPERDEPMDVANPDISNELGDGWELVRSDVLGEWDIQIMLRENGVASQRAADGAAGWGGSRFDVYESDSGALSLLTTRWDSDAEASEFLDAVLTSFGGDAANGAVWSESDRDFGVVANGDTVVIISGTDPDAVQSVFSLMEQSV